MKAIEFKAKAKDGTIEIPKKFINKLKNNFRVIILIEDSENSEKEKKKKFSALSLSTKDLHFDRDEANER